MIIQNSTNNKPFLIVPEVTKQLVVAANSISPISAGLITTIVLLVHRAQISAKLLNFKKQAVQQLPSIKWNAKQLAKAPIIRALIANLVTANTLNYELKFIRPLTVDEAQKHAQTRSEDLVDNSPSPGAKVLSPRAINEKNLKSHRHALMARNVGTWQARPIYDPTSVVKNVSPAILSANELGKLIVILHETFGIELDETFESILVKSEDPDRYKEAIRAVIDQHLNTNAYAEDKENTIVFDDAIDFNSPDNKTPIESVFSFIQRPKPFLEVFEQSLSPELINSPLFNYALNINKELTQDVKKTSTKGSNNSSNNSRARTNGKLNVEKFKRITLKIN